MPDENVTAGMLQDETRELWDILQKLHALPSEAIVPLPPIADSEGEMGEMEAKKPFFRGPKTCDRRGRAGCLIDLKDILNMMHSEPNV